MRPLATMSAVSTLAGRRGLVAITPHLHLTAICTNDVSAIYHPKCVADRELTVAFCSGECRQIGCFNTRERRNRTVTLRRLAMTRSTRDHA